MDIRDSLPTQAPSSEPSESRLFIVCRAPLALSDDAMKFCDFWIYDLRDCHPAWKSDLFRTHIWNGRTPWEALLKAYGIHTFTPLSLIHQIATDYHAFFRTSVSRRQIDEFLKILSRLGLQKYGHLLRLHPKEIQKRFGPRWASFFSGLTKPLEAPWPWKKICETPRLSLRIEEEFALYPDASLLCRKIDEALARLPSLFLERVHILLTLYENPEELSIPLQFSEALALPRERAWLLRLLEERLIPLQIPEALSAIHLHLYPTAPKPAEQLKLFRHHSHRGDFKTTMNRLRDQGFLAFQPQKQASRVPELSWSRVPAEERPSFEGESSSLTRPLWIGEARPFALDPQERLSFHERLEWIDESGARHRRDYFIAHRPQRWVWIFRNENHEWFEQGILE